MIDRSLVRRLVFGVLGSLLLAAPAGAGVNRNPVPGTLPNSHDPLHAFCVAPTPACTDNGTNTPTDTNPPNFGFWASEGPVTGDYLIDILVPNSEDPLPSGVTFNIKGIQGGPGNTDPIAATAALVSGTAWTSGFLDDYLGINGASPKNPIGAFLPSTVALVPAATGFFVYQADLSITQVQDQANKAAGPLLSISSIGGGFSPNLPLAAYAVSFLKTPGTLQTAIATQSSGALFIRHKAPEPASLALLGVGLLGLAIIRRRRGVRPAQ